LEKMVGAVGFEPTFSGFSSSFMVVFRCSFTRLPTDHDTSVSLVWQALFRINRQQSAEKCVSPCVARLVCVVIVSSSNLAGFCVELCRLARGRSSHCLTIETLCLGQVCAKSGQFLKAAPAGLPLILPPVPDAPGMRGGGGAARQRRPPRPLFIIQVTVALRLILPEAKSQRARPVPPGQP
jgi:hypothetical protein